MLLAHAGFGNDEWLLLGRSLRLILFGDSRWLARKRCWRIDDWRRRSIEFSDGPGRRAAGGKPRSRLLRSLEEARFLKSPNSSLRWRAGKAAGNVLC